MQIDRGHLPSSCSCPFEDSTQQFGQHGWHVHLDGANGTAYERCPAYARACGHTVDPMPWNGNHKVTFKNEDGTLRTEVIKYRGGTRYLSTSSGGGKSPAVVKSIR